MVLFNLKYFTLLLHHREPGVSGPPGDPGQPHGAAPLEEAERGVDDAADPAGRGQGVTHAHRHRPAQDGHQTRLERAWTQS